MTDFGAIDVTSLIPDLTAGTGTIGKDLFNLPDDFGLEQSEYDFNHRVFPSDIGQPGYNGHYMVINIAVSNNSNFETLSGPGGNIPTFHRTGDLSKVDALRQSIDTRYRTAAGAAGYDGWFIPRFTRRIKESIAIYMPGTMTFSTNNVYEDVSLTELGKTAISWGAGFAAGALASRGPRGAVRSSILGAAVGGVLNAALGAAERAGQVFGTPLNPRTEVLFSNTSQRQFQFEFLFAPATEKESHDLEAIIYALRFHAAPELNPITLGGILWTVPSEFDITFYDRGKENTSIPRINTCVLEQIDVDYAPSGQWATFSNGYPVQIRMQLRFREVEVVHRLRVAQGF
jgi:hypothetical protein